MQLYLIRHAIAVDRGAAGVVDDRSRELTIDGIRKMRRVAAGLSKLIEELDEVWTSPLVRARQTAEIVCEEFGLRRPPQTVPALEPGGKPQDIVARLVKHAGREGIALVGHEPDLGELATFLIAGTRRSGIRFKKGGVACIEISDFHAPVRGELCWLLTPGQLRAIK